MATYKYPRTNIFIIDQDLWDWARHAKKKGETISDYLFRLIAIAREDKAEATSLLRRLELHYEFDSKKTRDLYAGTGHNSWWADIVVGNIRQLLGADSDKICLFGSGTPEDHAVARLAVHDAMHKAGVMPNELRVYLELLKVGIELKLTNHQFLRLVAGEHFLNVLEDELYVTMLAATAREEDGVIDVPPLAAIAKGGQDLYFHRSQLGLKPDAAGDHEGDLPWDILKGNVLKMPFPDVASKTLSPEQQQLVERAYVGLYIDAINILAARQAGYVLDYCAGANLPQSPQIESYLKRVAGGQPTGQKP